MLMRINPVSVAVSFCQGVERVVGIMLLREQLSAVPGEAGPDGGDAAGQGRAELAGLESWCWGW